ncbi:MAG: DUF4350 domain-containing protein [Planctomycetes bacterium]|nr:DUF4350 domain-containing protein [Planctomycetota bacterium]
MAEIELSPQARRRLAVRLAFLTFAAVLLAAALIALAERSLGLGTRLDQGHHSWSYSPTGFRALYEVLVRLGFKVRRFQRSYASLSGAGPTTLPGGPDESVLVTLDPGLLTQFTRGENIFVEAENPRSLERWVEAGGRLVVTLPGRTLASVAGLEVVLDDEPESLGGAAGSGRIAEPILDALRGLPRTTPHALPARLRGYGPLDGLEAEVPALDAAAERALEPYLAPGAEGGVPLFEAGAGASPLVTLDEAPLVLEQRSGDGSVISVSTPLPFANAALRAHAEAVVVLFHHATDGGERTILLDEYAHGFTDRGGPLRWALETALFYPLATAIAAIALLGWLGAVRHGPPLADRAPPRRAKEELVLSLADLHRRGGHRQHALLAVSLGYEARLAALLGEHPGAPAAQLDGSLEPEAAAAPLDDRGLLAEGRRLHGEYRRRKETLMGTTDRRGRG